MTLLEHLVRTFAILSLISIGGANATLPEIHRQVVDLNHWMSDATFAKVVAIGQTAPGPNVMVVSMVGWQVAGIAGLVAATLAMVLPSSVLAVVFARVAVRAGEAGRIALARRALAPVALGFMLASAVVMTRAAWQGVGTLAIVGCVATAMVLTKLSPIWGIAAGAVVGLASRRLGWL